MFLLINAVDTTAKTFRVIGDVTTVLSSGSYIQVLKSTGNNGIYELVSAVYASGYTTLTTVESIPSAVADGNIAAGVYELKFSDETLAGKAPLIIPPWGQNTTTPLTFNGKASLNFGEHQQQNILSVLENFAASTAPLNPTIGQHWFDSSNSVIKVYTATGWSSDLNVEGGSISFKDPQHPTANTKYFITAAEPVGKTSSGVTLYPATNPTAGMSMFRIVDASGVLLFEVDYNGKLISANPLEVTAASVSQFNHAVSTNTTGAAVDGLLVKNNIVVTTGDVSVDSGKGLKTAGGASLLLTGTATLRGTTVANGVEVQATGGTALTRFADDNVTFYVPVIGTSLTMSGNGSFGTLGVTGVSTLNATTATTLSVSGASNLTTLTVSGNSTLAGTTATALSVSGTSTLGITNINNTLGVTGVATFSDRVVAAFVPTVGSDLTNKTYVDGLSTSLINTKVAKAGDTMSGNLSMGGVARVTNALDPINPQDYVTLNSLNNLIMNGGTF